MKTNALLTLVALLEIATGAALLLAPSMTAGLLLGGSLAPGTAVALGRVAGLALVAIGLVCWLERSSARAGRPTALLAGLLVYNTAVPIVLVHGYFAQAINGLGLWPAALGHLLIAAWLVAILARGDAAGLPKQGAA